jgi:hypothetical protein
MIEITEGGGPPRRPRPIVYIQLPGEKVWHIYYHPIQSHYLDVSLALVHVWCGNYQAKRYGFGKESYLLGEVVETENICQDCLTALDDFHERVKRGGFRYPPEKAFT